MNKGLEVPLRSAGEESVADSEIYWMKKCCNLCPYSKTKTLGLHPERAEDFAYSAQNRFNDFPCHKTAELSEDDDGYGEYVHGERSLTCHGFMTLQASENGDEEFQAYGNGFTDVWEMIEHHERLWDERNKRIRA